MVCETKNPRPSNYMNFTKEKHAGIWNAFLSPWGCCFLLPCPTCPLSQQGTVLSVPLYSSLDGHWAKEEQRNWHYGIHNPRQPKSLKWNPFSGSAPFPNNIRPLPQWWETRQLLQKERLFRNGEREREGAPRGKYQDFYYLKENNIL